MNDIEMIPLAKLRLSEANVRKNDSNLFIEELAANIEAKGLLQNLAFPERQTDGAQLLTGFAAPLTLLQRDDVVRSVQHGQARLMIRRTIQVAAQLPASDAGP